MEISKKGENMKIIVDDWLFGSRGGEFGKRCADFENRCVEKEEQ